VNFQKHEKYRRQEIWEIVKGLDEKISRNFQQSGYERIDDNLFAFVNIITPAGEMRSGKTSSRGTVATRVCSRAYSAARMVGAFNGLHPRRSSGTFPF
jgi:hypothetical protein